MIKEFAVKYNRRALIQEHFKVDVNKFLSLKKFSKLIHSQDISPGHLECAYVYLLKK